MRRAIQFVTLLLVGCVSSRTPSPVAVPVKAAPVKRVTQSNIVSASLPTGRELAPFVYPVPMTNCWLQWTTNYLSTPVVTFTPAAGWRATWSNNPVVWNDAYVGDVGITTNAGGKPLWWFTNSARLNNLYFRVAGEQVQ